MPGPDDRPAAQERRPRILSTAQDAPRRSIAQWMPLIRDQGGPGPWRQVLDLARIANRRTGIAPAEYYAMGMWRPDRRAELLREFVPRRHYRRFAFDLLVPELGPALDVIADKLAAAAAIGAKGVETTRTLAAFGPPPPDGADGIAHLSDAGGVAAFLADPARYPLFGKPRFESRAYGAVGLAELLPGGDDLRLTNGVTVRRQHVADEIARDWSAGYLLQALERPAAALRPHMANAMGTLRIVTIRTARGIEPFYAIMRMPSATAMHDGASSSDTANALLDTDSGEVLAVRYSNRAYLPSMTHWIDRQTPFLGKLVPHYRDAVAAVTRAHDAFPAHGLLGWDVFSTERGALVNEVNAKPFHVYQRAADRGLMNPDLAPIYRRGLAYVRAASGQPSPAADESR